MPAFAHGNRDKVSAEGGHRRGDGHAADDFVTCGAECLDAGRKCRARGDDVIDQHDSPGLRCVVARASAAVPYVKCLCHVLFTPAPVTLGLLLGVP